MDMSQPPTELVTPLLLAEKKLLEAQTFGEEASVAGAKGGAAGKAAAAGAAGFSKERKAKGTYYSAVAAFYSAGSHTKTG